MGSNQADMERELLQDQELVKNHVLGAKRAGLKRKLCEKQGQIKINSVFAKRAELERKIREQIKINSVVAKKAELERTVREKQKELLQLKIAQKTREVALLRREVTGQKVASLHQGQSPANAPVEVERCNRLKQPDPPPPRNFESIEVANASPVRSDRGLPIVRGHPPPRLLSSPTCVILDDSSAQCSVDDAIVDVDIAPDQLPDSRPSHKASICLQHRSVKSNFTKPLLRLASKLTRCARVSNQRQFSEPGDKDLECIVVEPPMTPGGLKDDVAPGKIKASHRDANFNLMQWKGANLPDKRRSFIKKGKRKVYTKSEVRQMRVAAPVTGDDERACKLRRGFGYGELRKTAAQHIVRIDTPSQHVCKPSDTPASLSDRNSDSCHSGTDRPSCSTGSVSDTSESSEESMTGTSQRSAAHLGNNELHRTPRRTGGESVVGNLSRDCSSHFGAVSDGLSYFEKTAHLQKDVVDCAIAERDASIESNCDSVSSVSKSCSKRSASEEQSKTPSCNHGVLTPRAVLEPHAEVGSGDSIHTLMEDDEKLEDSRRDDEAPMEQRECPQEDSAEEVVLMETSSKDLMNLRRATRRWRKELHQWSLQAAAEAAEAAKRQEKLEKRAKKVADKVAAKLRKAGEAEALARQKNAELKAIEQQSFVPSENPLSWILHRRRRA